MPNYIPIMVLIMGEWYILAYMYFAKVNVNEKIFEVYKNPKLLDNILLKLVSRLNSDVVLDLPKNSGQIKFITLGKNEDGTVYGRLVKVFKDDIQIYSPEKDDVEDLSTDKMARSATFFFDIRKEVVAFTTGRYFGHKQFCEFFQLLLNACMGEEAAAFKVFLIKDKNEFTERLKYFNKITRINITIVPKNPGREAFQAMFANPEAVESTNAKSFEQTFQANGRSDIGLNIENNYMQNAINGVVHGYGDMKVQGVGIDAQVKTISSDIDAPERMAIPDSEKTSIPAIVERGREGIVKVLAKLMRLSL